MRDRGERRGDSRTSPSRAGRVWMDPWLENPKRSIDRSRHIYAVTTTTTSQATGPGTFVHSVLERARRGRHGAETRASCSAPAAAETAVPLLICFRLGRHER